MMKHFCEVINKMPIFILIRTESHFISNQIIHLREIRINLKKRGLGKFYLFNVLCHADNWHSLFLNYKMIFLIHL